MRNMNKFYAVIVLMLSCASVTQAALVCNGTISELAFHSPGQIMIKLSTMDNLVTFCSVDNNWAPAGAGYSTSVESCKAMYSAFLAARVSEKNITNMYFDGDQVPTACGSWGTGKQANIRHYKI